MTHKNIYRLPREAVFNLTDNTGKVHQTELMTQTQANKLNKVILYLDRHYVGRDMTGLWVSEGQFDRVEYEFEVSKIIKKEIGKSESNKDG